MTVVVVDLVRLGQVCPVLQHNDDGSRRDNNADPQVQRRVEQQQRDVGVRKQQLLRRLRPAAAAGRELRPARRRKFRPSSAAALLSVPKPKRGRPRPAGHAADQPGLTAPSPSSGQLQERRLLLKEDFSRAILFVFQLGVRFAIAGAAGDY